MKEITVPRIHRLIYTVALWLTISAALTPPLSAQVAINPAPVPQCVNGDTLLYNGTTWTCSPAGAGTITGSGTVGNIPKRSAATVLADSILSESAGVVTAAGAVTVTGNLRSNTALILAGATSGTTTIKAAAVAGTTTITFPGGTTDFSATGGTSQVVRQSSAGAAFTVSQLTYADIGSGGNIVTSGVGPHAIGTTTNSDVQLIMAGSFTGTVNTQGLLLNPTLQSVANGFSAVARILGTLNKAASGTHGVFAGLQLDAPVIGAGAATLGAAATVYIVAAPTGATNNYALWVDAGVTRVDSYIESTGVAFAGLGTPPNGSIIFCSDCTIANPCASGGTGALAKRLNGAWVCN